jgi:hypothetical protein
MEAIPIFRTFNIELSSFYYQSSEQAGIHSTISRRRAITYSGRALQDAPLKSGGPLLRCLWPNYTYLPTRLFLRKPMSYGEMSRSNHISELISLLSTYLDYYSAKSVHL